MQVFISHSAKGDSSAEAFARRLKGVLEPDFEVFLDLDDLKVGDDWAAKLRDRAVRADAGIIILTRKLLARSKFTRKELTWLVGGRDRGECLVLPVLLEGLSAADLAASDLDVFGLQQSQYVDGGGSQAAIAQIREQLLSVSSKRLAPYLQATALRAARKPRVLSALKTPSRIHPPTLRHWPRDGSSGGAARSVTSHAMISALALLDPPHDLTVQGGSGIGKSTLLRYLAGELIARWKSGTQRRWLPIWVSAPGLAKRTGELKERLHQEFCATHSIVSLEADLFKEGPTKNAGWLVLIDGLDEVPASAREELFRGLKEWATAIPRHHRFVLSSRPLALLNAAASPFERYDVLPIERSELRAFASTLFDDGDGARSGDAERFVVALESSRAGDRLGNPLLIVLAADAYARSGGGELPPTRSALYAGYVAEGLSNERWNRFKDELIEHWEKKLDAAYAARRVLQRIMDPLPRPGSRERFRPAVRARGGGPPLLCALARVPAIGNNLAAQAVAWAEATLSDWPPDFEAERAWVEAQFVEILLATGLFEHAAGNLDFVHDTFRDFLAAWDRTSSGLPAALEALEATAGRRNLEEALFLVGLAHDQGEAIENLVQRLLRARCADGADEPFDEYAYSGPVLAAHIAAEIPVEPEMVRQVIATLATATSSIFVMSGLIALMQRHPEARQAVLHKAIGVSLFFFHAGEIASAGDWDLLREILVNACETGTKIDCADALGGHDPDEGARRLYELIPVAKKRDLRSACSALARHGPVDCAHSALLYAYRSAAPEDGFEYLAELSKLPSQLDLHVEAETRVAPSSRGAPAWRRPSTGPEGTGRTSGARAGLRHAAFRAGPRAGTRCHHGRRTRHDGGSSAGAGERRLAAVGGAPARDPGARRCARCRSAR